MHIIVSAYGALLLAYTISRNIKDIHNLQQYLYKNKRYWKWLCGKHHKFFKDSDFALAASGVSIVIALLSGNMAVSGVFTIVSVLSLMFSKFVYDFWASYHKTKIKLNYTDRVKRLIFTSSLVTILITATPFVVGMLSGSTAWLVVGIISSVTLNIFSFVSVMLAALINQPVETNGANFYINDAKRILSENKNLIVVGVTGSYGKTSVKNILGKMLSEKYSVLITPESYNTTMGVVRTIRERLKPYHEVFVVEMGAHEPGDIKEICDIVNPRYSLITSIGEQHMETFKTFENVIRTKGEIFDGTVEGGTVFINLADDNISSIPLKNGVEIITYLEKHHRTDFSENHIDMKLSDNTRVASKNLPEPFVFPVETKVSDTGSTVIMKTSSGDTFGVTTKMLGRHNIDNITACSAVALKLGVSVEQINRALFDIEPVKHRLSYHKTSGGYTIIDDAFNSNPVGSKNALEVLRLFSGGKKYIITPGMIELGPNQDEYNRKFGEYIAKSVDFAVLVGEKQTIPIQEGVISGGLPAEKLHVAKNLTDAFEKVGSMIKSGDVLLLENDLPDIFNEK